ncbi:hypothetical protein GH733_000656, partial [Mirounga leonina]
MESGLSSSAACHGKEMSPTRQLRRCPGSHCLTITDVPITVYATMRKGGETDYNQKDRLLFHKQGGEKSNLGRGRSLNTSVEAGILGEHCGGQHGWTRAKRGPRVACPLYLVVPLLGCRGSVHVFGIPDVVKSLVQVGLQTCLLMILSEGNNDGMWGFTLPKRAVEQQYGMMAQASDLMWFNGAIFK